MQTIVTKQIDFKSYSNHISNISSYANVSTCIELHEEDAVLEFKHFQEDVGETS